VKCQRWTWTPASADDVGMTIIDVLTNPEVFGPHFTSPMWRVWFVLLKALFGLKLTTDSLRRLKQARG
jgi:hypothetical protein